MAAVQVAAWRASYAGVLPAEVLDTLAADDIAATWRHALTRPPDARNRALVALDHASVRGFTTTGPGTDPDLDPIAVGELGELVVDPGHRRAGHGSRLLHAAVDTLRADRFVRAVTWVPAAADDLRAFLTGTGWAADGAHRTLDLTGDGTVVVKQVRLHTSLGEAA